MRIEDAELTRCMDALMSVEPGSEEYKNIMEALQQHADIEKAAAERRKLDAEVEKLECEALKQKAEAEKANAEAKEAKKGSVWKALDFVGKIALGAASVALPMYMYNKAFNEDEIKHPSKQLTSMAEKQASNVKSPLKF